MNLSIFTNARIATLSPSIKTPYGMFDNGALVVENDRIVWLGPQDELPVTYQDKPHQNLEGRLITPAFIDCHTHLIFGGDRAEEFEMRLNGASYEDISLAGGGIISTVRNTRALSEDALVQNALPRLDSFLLEGAGTIEIKSGYGLTIEDELKMLRATRKLATLRDIRIITTFLGAHAIPIEYAGNADGYIDEVCIPALIQGAKDGLIDHVDAFCEGIGFTRDQVKRVFECAKSLNIPVKIHAEQLSNLQGAALAASFNALSADHLEFLDQDGIDALKKSNSVAVLLPGAFYTLRETKMPPIEGLRKAAVDMALATDCNPGSSPLTSLLLCMNMACTIFRFTPEEALIGITRNAAKALGLQDEIGTLEVGKRAEMSIWGVKHPAELSYRIGFNPLFKRVYGDPQ